MFAKRRCCVCAHGSTEVICDNCHFLFFHFCRCVWFPLFKHTQTSVDHLTVVVTSQQAEIDALKSLVAELNSTVQSFITATAFVATTIDYSCQDTIDDAGDADSDVICISVDSCPNDAENDADGDSVCGNVDSCAYDAENDADGDLICGDEDSCKYDAENDADTDSACGDVELCPYDAEDDADSDAICGDVDSCEYDPGNDVDSDVICGDVDSCDQDAENDADNDLLCSTEDRCPYDAEHDADSDGVCGDVDSCEYDAANDADSDTICGDVDSCDLDAENDNDVDLICGDVDSCKYDAENDADDDAICGDVDSCQYDPENDADVDFICGNVDSCQYDAENDADVDLICGDVDSCKYDAENDADGDLICGDVDSCKYDAENDADGDLICGDVDSCQYDAENDADGDSICGNVDSCQYDAEHDADGDVICGDVDSCKYDAENDADGDNICGDVDSCQYDAENDADGDNICGNVDSCPYDAENDADVDSICGDLDSCKYDAENDVDDDFICGDVDSCKVDAENDADSDTICAELDSCDYDAEHDADSDEICGDVDSCRYDVENDADSDLVCGNIDSCPYDAENDYDGDVICGDVNIEFLSSSGLFSFSNSSNVEHLLNDLYPRNSLLTNETADTSVFVIVMDSDEARETFQHTPMIGLPRSPIGEVVLNSFDENVMLVSVRFDEELSHPDGEVDGAADSNDLDNYMSVTIEKYDKDADYVDSEVTFTICLSTNLGNEEAMIVVLRRGKDDATFTEITSVEKVAGSPGCFAITSKTSTFLIADVTGQWNMPQYDSPDSSSENSFVDTVKSFGCDRSMGGGTGLDCEQRVCPYGLAPSANRHAADDDASYSPFGSSDEDTLDGMHSYFECSNAGVCDRAIGTCDCNDDREGAACERNKCPNNCNFHGLCRTLALVAGELVDMESLSGKHMDWNGQTYQQCDCDAGWFGGDCSLRQCPMGVNPLEICEEKSSFDIQNIDLSAIDSDSFFVLDFTSWMGSAFTTHPLPQTASAGYIQRALEQLPTSVLPSVQVSRDNSDNVQVTFSDSSTLGEQALLKCNPSTITSQCESGAQPKFLADFANDCTVSRVGEPETDSTKGYFEVSTCSGQGTCNAGSGTCECFLGFYGLRCDRYAQIS